MATMRAPGLPFIGFGFVALALAAGIYVYGIHAAWYGELEDAGEIAAGAVPEPVLRERSVAQSESAQRLNAAVPKQILFGDLHVHTTFSTDAFRMTLPMVQGDGAHPPADACDFARVCAGLDFWALTDHAESLTADRWRQSIDSVRQCNAIAGDAANPDLVSFIGFEWTQAGPTPETHYGHKNVIFLDTEPQKLPARPIGSPFRAAFDSIPTRIRLLPPLRDLPNRRRYYDFNRLIQELSGQAICPAEGHVRDLPADCAETAPTPDVLFRKLDEWGMDSMVIPHGTSWGIYSPAGTSLDKQLSGAMHDPERQTLIEVFSGHGASEVHRDWRAVTYDENGERVCPPPRADYLPSCWRAGELIRERCLAEGADAEDCSGRAQIARQKYLDYGQVGWHTVPGTVLEDWLDAGQCRDCFLPSFNYRPGGSAQYGLALGNFETGDRPRRFRFGFMASSDNHTARPGTGYKQYARQPMTDWWGYADARSRRLFSTDRGAPSAASVEVNVAKLDVFNILELERQASFFSTGGLVATHARGRSREAIWDALKGREVYGTSGQRILLWFDLLADTEDGSPVRPMGSETRQRNVPRFRVRALGALEQKPGCPDHSVNALSPQRLALLCRGECYHPSSQRAPIEQIDVIRIRPQMTAGEPVAPLIEDPWRTFPCDPGDGDGCTVEFSDPEFTAAARDTVYYVRALQAPQPMINAGGFRCETDEAGNCRKVNACYGDDRTAPQDQCLSDVRPRAWSSPIFIDFDQNATR
ncbi:MAG: DUF3604 domain-containing protein [Pseudomonadota bacterium]